MKKVVLKVELYDDKVKQKAMKVVSGLSGVDSIAMDMKDKKLTVTGDIDPVTIVGKLRKLCHTEIVTVGPAKEPEKKKEDGKAGEVKKQEPKKKDDPKKEEPKKKDEPKKDEKKKEPKDDSGSQDTKAMAYPMYTQPSYYPQQPPPPYYPQHHPYYPPQQPYYPPQQQVYYNQQAYSYQQSPVPTHYYYHRSVEEDPNSCVIC